jgi:hypothetical protein
MASDCRGSFVLGHTKSTEVSTRNIVMKMMHERRETAPPEPMVSCRLHGATYTPPAMWSSCLGATACPPETWSACHCRTLGFQSTRLGGVRTATFNPGGQLRKFRGSHLQTTCGTIRDVVQSPSTSAELPRARRLV